MVQYLDIDKFLMRADFRLLNKLIWPWESTHFILSDKYLWYYFNGIILAGVRLDAGGQVIVALFGGCHDFDGDDIRICELYIYDSANSVTMMDSSISLAASCYFDIDLEIFAIDSSPEVKALSLQTRKCVLPTDRGHGGGNFYQKCIATLIMRKVVNYCKCLPFKYTADYLDVNEYPSCTWERYLCVYSQVEYNFADMHSLIRMNDCYQKCDYVEYDSRMDFIRSRKLFSQNKRYTRFAVHYASTTCMKYRREVIYTWDQMLANLGGIFGLCLGGSIISIIEIVWFLIDLLAGCLYNFRRLPKPTEKKIAFVMENDKDNVKQGKNKDTCYKFMN